MGSPYFQNIAPAAAPDPVTPQAAPADAAGWGAVTPENPGTADYDISAPQSIAGITAAFNAAGALSAGAENDIYPVSPRQQEAQAMQESPAGAPEMSVVAGFPDYESADVSPGANMTNPIQSQGPSSGPYPGTLQDGVPQFMAGLGGDRGVPGVTPETGTMSDEANETGNPGGHYPGTIQSGLPMYGTGH